MEIEFEIDGPDNQSLYYRGKYDSETGRLKDEEFSVACENSDHVVKNWNQLTLNQQVLIGERQKREIEKIEIFLTT